MENITIDVGVRSGGDENLGIKPMVADYPLVFDVNFLMYYILYEDTIGFAIGGVAFVCKKTEENIDKLRKAFELKILQKDKI